MKNKKIIFITLFIFLFSLIISCTNSSNTIYNITYYSNGEIIEHSPSKYIAGEETLLSPLEEDQFIGWFDNEECNGEKVTKITSSQTGDIRLYAKWEEESQIKTLNDQINKMKNYMFTYSYMYVDEEGTSIYQTVNEYYENNFRQYIEFDDFTLGYEYLGYVDDVLYYFGLNEDDTYYTVDEFDDYFDYYAAFFDVLYLESLSDIEFEMADNEYTLLDSTKTNEVAINLLGEFVDAKFENLIITVDDKYISKISVDLMTTSFDGIDYHIEVEIDNVNNVSFSLPLVNPLQTSLTCAEAKEFDDDEQIIVKGQVVGTIGNNFYIESGNAGIYIYGGTKNLVNEKLAIGQTVIVTGIKSTYCGLVELTNVSSVEVLEENEYEPTTLTEISQQTLIKMVGMGVNVSNLTICSSVENLNLSNDITIEVIIGTNKTQLFISRHLNESVKSKILNSLRTLEKNESFSLSLAVVSYHNNPQIVITEFTTINFTTEITDVSLIVPSKIVVAENTPFVEAINNLVIKVKKSNNETIILNKDEYILNSDDYQMTEGTYVISVSYKSLQATFEIVVSKDTSGYYEMPANTQKLDDVLDIMGQDKYTGEIYGITRGLPSVGNPKILVIPVAFTDYTADNNMVSTLEKAFFGTSDDTGWESLNSYYYKSSYGKLNIEGEVLPVYQTNKSSKYYERKSDGDYEIIQSALRYYDNVINYADFDSDNDGYIDAIYLVYTCPINYTDSDSMWWAYTYEYFTDEVELYDNVEADFYLLAGYDFLFETPSSNKKLKLNLETFIHETGHLLGLDDYYDTDLSNGPAGGLGGGDMMDNNVGDHNAFSKALLGWVNPLIVTNTSTITIEKFSSSGDCVIIAKNFENSLFTEFYIIDFYTPDGLNEMENGNCGLFSSKGIRIYHIDATLASPVDCNSIWDIYAYNNSTTDHKLITIVEADGNNDIVSGDEYGNYASNSDLFKLNDIWRNMKWYDGTSAGFTLEVISIDDSSATIQITY